MERTLCFCDSELREGPRGALQKHQEAHRVIWAICFLLETSGGLEFSEGFSWHVWTRTACSEKREGPAWGSEVLEVGPAYLPEQRSLAVGKKAEPRALLPSCRVRDCRVESSCGPTCPAPPAQASGDSWENCPVLAEPVALGTHLSLPGLEKSILCPWSQGLSQVWSCDPGQPMRLSLGPFAGIIQVGESCLPSGLPAGLICQPTSGLPPSHEATRFHIPKPESNRGEQS